MRRWLHRRRNDGDLMQRTVVVGRADAALALLKSIKAEASQGLKPVAVCASGLDTDWDATTALEAVGISLSDPGVVTSGSPDAMTPVA